MNTVPHPTAEQRLRRLCDTLTILCNEAWNQQAVGVTTLRRLVDEATQVEPANPVIRSVVDALLALTDGDLDYAQAVLRATRPGLLTDREYAQVMGWLGQRRRKCASCGGVLLFVADGPQPGWWEHDRLPDEQRPCRGAVPEVTR